MMSGKCGDLNACALGLGMGVVYALSLFFMGMLATYLHIGYSIVRILGDYYSGYGVGFMPSLIGAAWGFVDGLVVGFLLGYFYNFFNERCCP